jgi:transcriptional regulator with XRE-family HTH domain
MNGVILKDLARAAGVSLSTASRGLRDDPRIGAATRARLRALANKLGYRPDPALSALSNYRARRRREEAETIAYLGLDPRPEGEDLSRSPNHQAAWERARRLGYELRYFACGHGAAAQRRCSRMLHARGVRGLLVGVWHLPPEELAFDWTRFAAIAVSGLPTRRVLHSVTTNYLRSAGIALEELARRGYRRPGFCLSAPLTERYRELVSGWALVPALFPAAPLPSPWVPATPDDTRWRGWAREHDFDVLVGQTTPPPAWRRRRDLDFCSLDIANARADAAGVFLPRHRLPLVAFDLLHSQLRARELGPRSEIYSVQLPGEWRDGPTLRN